MRTHAIAKAEERLEAIVARDGADPENDHMDADDVLVRLLRQHPGCERVVALYESITRKWYA